MRRTQMCPDCDGSGGMYGKMDLPSEPFIWEPACPTCRGAGLLDGNALVHVRGAGTDLVTVDYVWRRFHLGRHFLDGYEEARRFRTNLPMLAYVVLRDYLLDFEVDYITACQIALHLTPYTWNFNRDQVPPIHYFNGIV